MFFGGGEFRGAQKQGKTGSGSTYCRAGAQHPDRIGTGAAPDSRARILLRGLGFDFNFRGWPRVGKSRGRWRRGNELQKKRAPDETREPVAFCGGGERCSESVLPDLCGHKGKRSGVRRIFQVEHAKSHRMHRRTSVHVRCIGDAIKIRYALSTESTGEDLCWKNGCGRNVKVRGNGVNVESSGGSCGGCGDEARPA